MNANQSTYDATESAAASGSLSGGMRRSNAMTIRLLCIYGVFDGADVALLPASFRALEASYGFSPTRLGLLAVVQGVSMSVAGPFWGALADAGFSRRKLLAAGAFMWSILLIGLACTTDFRTMMVLRALNGIAMGMLTPVVQSLVAEQSHPDERGQNFGWIEFFRLSIGMMTVMVFVTSISNQIIFGIHGFRVAFLVTALGGLILAPSILWLMEEEDRVWRPERLSVSGEITKLVEYWKIPTFRVIVIQGCFGSITGAAMQFLAMYFQYIGLRDSQSGLLAGVNLSCCGLGYVLGGTIGDRWAKSNPFHGRAFTAQASVLIGIPLYYVMFQGLPRDSSVGLIFLALIIVQGLTGTWAKTGCNKPIFLEIVPKHSIGSAIAWENCIEKTVGQLVGPVAVGLLADRVFGYDASIEQVSVMAPEVRMQNAVALGHALCLSTMVPDMICLCLYSRLHWTYERDILSAKALEKADESDSSPATRPATEKTTLV